jgi:hypothetical protein
MKYLATIISIASLAAATMEMAPGTINTQQGGQRITIDSVEALRILVWSKPMGNAPKIKN